LDRPLQQRWETLLALQPLPDALRLAQVGLARSAEEIDAAFAAARARKNEGLMIKDPESPYTPGRRGLSWLKLKMAFDTLDCVVVGAEYGHGKRKNVLSDYTFAVRDEETGELSTIGKAYSGLTDIEIAELTEHFKKQTIKNRGRYREVKPDTVLEIAFDSIQPSTRHASGLALRFPRILGGELDVGRVLDREQIVVKRVRRRVAIVRASDRHALAVLLRLIDIANLFDDRLKLRRIVRDPALILERRCVRGCLGRSQH